MRCLTSRPGRNIPFNRTHGFANGPVKAVADARVEEPDGAAIVARGTPPRAHHAGQAPLGSKQVADRHRCADDLEESTSKPAIRSSDQRKREYGRVGGKSRQENGEFGRPRWIARHVHLEDAARWAQLKVSEPDLPESKPKKIAFLRRFARSGREELKRDAVGTGFEAGTRGKTMMKATSRCWWWW